MMESSNRTATLGDISEVRGEIGQLRKDMNYGLGEITGRLDALARGFVTNALCREKHDAQDEALDAAVAASVDDREKLWGAHRDNASSIDDLRKLVVKIVWVTAGGAITLLTGLAIAAFNIIFG